MSTPMRSFVGPRIVTGPEAVKAVASMAATQDRRDEWPYPWSFSPPNALRVFRVGSLVSPNPATQTEVLRYQVPQGFRFWLTAILQAYQGAGWIAGSGDILWTLDKNQPVGVAALQGEIIQGFGNIGIGLGAMLNGCVTYMLPLSRPELLLATDVLRSKVTTTVAIPAGGTNYFHSIFDGWLEPETKGR